MTHLGDVCALVVFTTWFVLSVFHQFTNQLGEWIRKRNTYALVPGYTFFAPNPGTSDYRFVVRDVFADGSNGAWEEIAWCRRRSVLDAFWNPERHRVKVVVDCMNGLAQQVNELTKLGVDVNKHKLAWIMSTPYLLLLHQATSMPMQSPQATARQFAVVEQYPFQPDQPAQLVVCSSAHDL